MKQNELYHQLIEKNHLEHFIYLPKKLNFEVCKKYDIDIINCGFGTSMFNIAYGLTDHVQFDVLIDNMKKIFKYQPFAWWVPQSQCNEKFTDTLLSDKSFSMETTEYSMICDLSNSPSLQRSTSLTIEMVTNQSLLNDFISVLEPYDLNVPGFYKRMTDEAFSSSEKLYVGFEAGRPVTIGILYTNGDRAGVFSLITSEASRGNGYGTDMMIYLLNFAKTNQFRFVTLSASSDAGYRIYERLGFVQIGQFECYEYAGEQ